MTGNLNECYNFYIDFDLDRWVENKVGQLQNDLPNYLIATLFEELGITPYLKDPQCNVNRIGSGGWTSGMCVMVLIKD